MHLGQGFLSGNYPDLLESAAGDAFSSGRLILICRKCLAGMILVGEIDPDLWEKSHRDDSQLGNSS